MNLLIPALFFAFAYVLSQVLGRLVESSRLQRILGIAASGLGFLWLVGVRVATPHHWQGDIAPLVLPLMHLALSSIAYLAVPKRVLERKDTSLLLIIHGLILAAFVTPDLLSLMIAHALATSGVLYLAWLEPGRHLLDPETHDRLNVFTAYRAITVLGMLILIVVLGSTLLAFPPTEILAHLEMPAWARVVVVTTLASSLGLFPLHSWFPYFLSAPRLNLFLPMFLIELGTIVLVRFLAPLASDLGSSATALLICACAGLLYFALLLFGETRLKKIVGYLILSHICLLTIALLGFGEHARVAVVLGLANVVISGTGLLTCLSILVSRFGRSGVTVPSGLAKAFPEVAVCFLACSLSLVGFPGTVGFMSEEVLLKGTLGYQFLLVPMILLAVALNGYSCFRLFARIFYGSPTYSSAERLELSFRERLALTMIVLLLVANGVAPQSLILFAAP